MRAVTIAENGLRRFGAGPRRAEANGGSVPPAALDSPRAWRVAVSAATVVGVAFGTVYTFGTFFDAMAAEFNAGLGSTSVVFGITMFLFFGAGAGSGFLADRWGARPLVWAGGALFAGGLYATSHVQELWQGYITYGIGAGLGGGLFIAPLFATAAGWFVRHRAVAQGLVATGSGLGTLTLLPLSERLIETRGWRETYVILAVITAVVFLIGGALIDRPPGEAPIAAASHLRKVLRTPSFRWLAASGFLQSASMISAFAFIVPFATDAGVSSSTAALLVGIVGASSIVGRLALTGLSGRVGPVRMMQLTFLAQPVAFLVWLVAGGNVPLLVVFVVLLGVAYGGFVALVGTVTAHLFGVRGIGSVMGWVYLSAGSGSLFYPPLVGFLADATEGRALPIIAIVIASACGSMVLQRLNPDPVAGL